MRNDDAPTRLLLVDDNEDLCFSLQLMLSSAGYDVTVVADGETALAVMDRVRPHCVVFDVHLPGISGFELCHRLRQRHNPPVLIAMSGKKIDALDRAAGIRIGADDYMVKPIFGEELLARLEAVMRRSAGAHRDVSLTKRETQVLQMFSHGSSPAEIGKELFISPKTVETHLENIRAKVGGRSRSEAMEAAESLMP